MRRGYLSAHFTGAGVKTLAAVDVISKASRQHEVTSYGALRKVLGEAHRTTKENNRFIATYIWLDDEQEALIHEGMLSWYESRAKKLHRGPEWRLYYQTNPITQAMRAGDTLFVARRPDDRLLFIVTPAGSAVRHQLMWLFGLTEASGGDFFSREISDGGDLKLDFIARLILEEIGVEPEEPEDEDLERYIKKYELTFPSTRDFSKQARKSLPLVSALDDPDQALMAWMNREELLFRALERKIVAERIKQGFETPDGADVDGFLKFSLSVQNRRKSRVGQAFENHLEEVFRAHQIKYARGVVTENGNRPDFLFPGSEEYCSPDFPARLLTMLGAKSTLKDRWRQVLSEAQKIETKHLITLEPGISENQTGEMQAKKLQLVVPKPLHDTFTPFQRSWLMNMKDFIALVRDRQNQPGLRTTLL